MIGELLKKLRQNKKLTLQNLADELKILYPDSTISKGQLSKWENDKDKPLLANAKLLADFYGIALDDLLNERIDFDALNNNDGSIRRYDYLPDVEYVTEFMRIPVLGTIACGEPILADENIIGYEYVSVDRAPNGKLFFLQCKGDSMEPKISDGSLVMIREQSTVENNEIAAVLVNGDSEATLKRVNYQGNTVMLIAENNAYPPYIVNEDNPAKIIGKAVQIVTKL